jgi:hypothetical protein
MWEAIAPLLQYATRSKSTVLKSLTGFICVTGLLALLAYSNPAASWLGLAFGVMALLGMVSFLAAYWYFAITNSEALRSEHFTLEKMAIEKGFRGDDVTGYMKRAKSPLRQALDVPTEDAPGEDEQ